MLLKGVDSDSCVPRFEHRHFGEFRHSLPIRRSGRSNRLIRDGLGKTTVPGCQYQAGSQPLDVPFPWTRKRFVEVVNVEQQCSFGRGKAAKVRQVAIAARLNGDSRHRCVSQISRLEDGCAAKERERRHRHPLVLNRDQTGDSIGVRFFQEFDDVFRLRTRLPLRLQRCAGNLSRSALPCLRLSLLDIAISSSILVLLLRLRITFQLHNSSPLRTIASWRLASRCRTGSKQSQPEWPGSGRRR